MDKRNNNSNAAWRETVPTIYGFGIRRNARAKSLKYSAALECFVNKNTISCAHSST